MTNIPFNLSFEQQHHYTSRFQELTRCADEDLDAALRFIQVVHADFETRDRTIVGRGAFTELHIDAYGIFGAQEDEECRGLRPAIRNPDMMDRIIAHAACYYALGWTPHQVEILLGEYGSTPCHSFISLVEEIWKGGGWRHREDCEEIIDRAYEASKAEET